MKDLHNYSLLKHNTFGIDVKCSRFLEFSSVDELQSVVEMLTPSDEPLLILGSGSNLLLTGDYQGTVLHSAIHGFHSKDDGNSMLLRCGSGELWDDVVAYCVKNSWYGAENLSLIPGEVGASAVQNIGAYGAEVKDIIYKVEAVEIASGKTVEFTNDECGYAYRQSKFKHEFRDKFVITYVTYRLAKTFVPNVAYGNIKNELDRRGITNPTAEQIRQIVIDIRRAKLPDPEVEGNAGSFFMNPIVGVDKYNALAALYPGMPHYVIDDEHVKIPSGWMIDMCGWKGRSLHRAGVHSKQALVLVNRGGATGKEILDLSDAIRRDVFDKFGIEIYPEVNIK
jgi:UDP-N-acetylmuramate dehydrogenase